MHNHQFLENIGLVAKDIWASKVFSSRPGNCTRYREPREALPFGFGWYIEEEPVSIEVHPVVDNGRVICLQIFGVQPKDGCLRMLLTEPV